MIFLALWLGLTPSAEAAKKSTVAKSSLVIDPEWDDRGIDTTQPQWYRKHPFWTHIQRPFRLQCDSIATLLSPSISSPLDPMIISDSGLIGEPVPHKAKTTTTTAYGLILFPTLFWSRPNGGTPLGLIRPEQGPWKLTSVFETVGKTFPPSRKDDKPREGTNPSDTTSHKGWRVLVSDSLGHPKGWVAFEEISVFSNFSDASKIAPFYKDGIAAYLQGFWVTPDKILPAGNLDGDASDNAVVGIGEVFIYDMIARNRTEMSALEVEDTGSYPEDLRKCLSVVHSPVVSDKAILRASCYDSARIQNFATGYKGAFSVEWSRRPSFHLTGCPACLLSLGATSRDRLPILSTYMAPEIEKILRSEGADGYIQRWNGNPRDFPKQWLQL